MSSAVAADAGLPPDDVDASALNLEDAEEFADQVKYISVSHSGVKDHPYAFVVVGEVYIPGYMVRQYKLAVGDWMRGMCKVAPAGARLPYRATSVEAVDTMSGNEGYEDEDNYDVEDDMGSSDGFMPTGARRTYDDDQSDTSDDQSNTVARNLLEYIEKHGGELRLAGPPHLVGSLANYYKQEPSSAETIKSWELADAKPGVHSFVRSFPSLFAVVGRHPNQKIVSAKAQPPQQGRAAPASPASSAADKAPGAAAAGGVSKAAQDAAKRAAAKDFKAAQSATGLLSKAAMEAAARAAGLTSKKPSHAGKSASAAAEIDVQDQLNELRSDLSVAMAALASAQQRMERLEAALHLDEAALTSSAA